MLCVRCKKRPAIVFVQKLEAGEAKSEGYCLSCCLLYTSDAADE